MLEWNVECCLDISGTGTEHLSAHLKDQSTENTLFLRFSPKTNIFKFMLEIRYEMMLHKKSHLGRIHVVVHEGVNDGGKLRLDDEVAGGFKVWNELAESVADLGGNINSTKERTEDTTPPLLVHLLDGVHNFLLGGVAGDEVVQVLHDVHADAAGQLISGLDQGRGGEDEGGEDDQDLGGTHTLGERSERSERREERAVYLHYNNSDSDLLQSGR